MAFPFPPSPTDGQIISYISSDGNTIEATYHAGRNEWMVKHADDMFMIATNNTYTVGRGTTDGDIIKWNTTTLKWEVDKLKLDELLDVEADTKRLMDGSPNINVEEGDILHYNSTKKIWEGVGIDDYTKVHVDIANLADATISGTLSEGQVLTWHDFKQGDPPVWTNRDVAPIGEWVRNYSYSKGAVVRWSQAPPGYTESITRYYRAKADIDGTVPNTFPTNWTNHVSTVTVASPLPPVNSVIHFSVSNPYGKYTIDTTVETGDTVKSIRDKIVLEINHSGNHNHVKATALTADGELSIKALDDFNHAIATPFVTPNPGTGIDPVSETVTNVGTTSLWEDITPEHHFDQIEGIDVHSVAPTDGQILSYNISTKHWENVDMHGGVDVWDPTVDYVLNNLVIHNGELYRAKTANKNDEPADKYTALITVPSGTVSGPNDVVEVNLDGVFHSYAISPGVNAGSIADALASKINGSPGFTVTHNTGDEFFRVAKDTPGAFPLTFSATTGSTLPTVSFTKTPNPDWDLMSHHRIGQLDNVADSAIQKGQTLIYNSTNQHYEAGSYNSVINYYGAGPLDTANAGNTPRWGTPVGTVPDVNQYPPTPGDTYVDSVTGTIYHWGGLGGAYYSSGPRNTTSEIYSTIVSAQAVPGAAGDMKLIGPYTVISAVAYSQLNPKDPKTLYLITA